MVVLTDALESKDDEVEQQASLLIDAAQQCSMVMAYDMMHSLRHIHTKGHYYTQHHDVWNHAPPSAGTFKRQDWDMANVLQEFEHGCSKARTQLQGQHTSSGLCTLNETMLACHSRNAL